MVREKKDRPLDCWEEVERFKVEVGKLEQVSCLIVQLWGRKLTRHRSPTGIRKVAAMNEMRDHLERILQSENLMVEASTQAKARVLSREGPSP